jgi:hypothetical protein
MTFRPDMDVVALIERASERLPGVNRSKLINEALREVLRPEAGKRIEVRPSKNFFTRN